MVPGQWYRSMLAWKRIQASEAKEEFDEFRKTSMLRRPEEVFLVFKDLTCRWSTELDLSSSLGSFGLLYFWTQLEDTSCLMGFIRWPSASVTPLFCRTILGLGNAQMVRQSSSKQDTVRGLNKNWNSLGDFFQLVGKIFLREVVSCHWHSWHELWNYLRSACKAILEHLKFC